MHATKRIVSVLLLTASGTVVAGAPSGGQAQGRAPSFETLDANADGVVTRKEAMAGPGLGERFDSLDANADGVLSREEIGIGGPSGKRDRDESEY